MPGLKQVFAALCKYLCAAGTGSRLAPRMIYWPAYMLPERAFQAHFAEPGEKFIAVINT